MALNQQAKDELQSYLGMNSGLEIRLTKVYGTKRQLTSDFSMGIVQYYATEKFQTEACN